MQAIDLPIKHHLSPSDQERLKVQAEALGLTPGDFMEAAIKRALFSDSSVRAMPQPLKEEKEGGRR
ncbi:hypothetical protein [Luteolibacter marinus]|uniref:hypothetical protein n=1 Tax=Luteolibacter marinus TaxID=2776705 RepID=UPI001865DF16|nr:hypothetical protein [Luteolibacter marinus]